MSLTNLFGNNLETPKIPEDQLGRRAVMLEKMLGNSRAVARAADLVMDIIERNERRMKLDADGNLVIAGRLAFYKVNLNGFLTNSPTPSVTTPLMWLKCTQRAVWWKNPKQPAFKFNPSPTCQPVTCLRGTFSDCSTMR